MTPGGACARLRRYASGRQEARVQLYLDCDGVLADFDAGAAAVFGMHPRRYEARHGLGRFWSALAKTPDFYAGLPPMPDAITLFEGVRHLDPIILTGVPRGGWAEAQKRRWAERHFPGTPIITTRAALKREHCHPGDVLVDDTLKYRPLWEEAGGVFIHHTSAAATLAELRSRYPELFEARAAEE
jgi:hypothetical protein